MSSPVEHSRYRGLSADEVETSRRKFGSNRLDPPAPIPWWRLYLEKFDDPIIRILMVAAVLAVGTGFFKGEHFEGLAIIVTIFLATFFGFLNEWKARSEFDLLSQAREDTPTKAIRGGTVQNVPRSDLVVGDIVIVETGDEIPADGRLLGAFSLLVDESRLTGESFPVAKVATVDHERSPADQDAPEIPTPPPLTTRREESEHPPGGVPEDEGTFPPTEVFRGTMVQDGIGIMEIRSVGNATEAGRVAASATESRTELTPLGRQLEKLGTVISFFGFTGAFFIFIALVGRGWSSGEFRLPGEQLAFLGIATVALVTATVRLWVPFLYEALANLGFEVAGPGFLADEGRGAWRRSAATGLGVFLGLAGFALLAGLLSLHPQSWFSLEAGRTMLRYFMIVVAVIVVAVPEGLAMAVTLCLAFGMRKMMADHNLVRNLHACETIGAATVICSDKTGTLTKNEMTVIEASFPGLGEEEPEAFWKTPVGRQLAEGIAVNTTANLSCDRSGKLVPVGNRTEGALLVWLQERDQEYVPLRGSFDLEKQWTFSPRRKFMATLGTSGRGGRPVLHVKGAPEELLARCTTVLSPKGPRPLAPELDTWEKRLRGFQTRGMRTLAFAFLEDPRSAAAGTHGESPIPAAHGPYPSEDPLTDELDRLAVGMTWLGCVAIADPIRPEVPQAIETCLEAGVQVKMVTGDNPLTAIEIARQIGLWRDDEETTAHLTGGEFHRLTDLQAMERLRTLKVLSRAKPLDKLRAVSLLEQMGQVVAVTGDGANDAPALNRADVGLSMGRVGTDMAKEASDIVLLDDSFASIATGIMWGRCLYLNIQRFLVFQLSINVTALGITLICPLLGLPTPLTVLQMLWVNLIMDSFAALALATEPPHPTLMARPPRPQGEFIISREMSGWIVRYGLFSVVFFVGLLAAMQNGGEVSPRRLSIFFTTFVLFQFWNLFNVRRFGLPGSGFPEFSANPWFLLVEGVILTGQVLIVQLGGGVFRTVPLSLGDWLLLLAGTASILALPGFLSGSGSSGDPGGGTGTVPGR